jgi:hypothetical protein
LSDPDPEAGFRPICIGFRQISGLNRHAVTSDATVLVIAWPDQVPARHKLGYHALAMLLLWPLLESYFQTTSELARHFGPLLLPTPHVRAFEWAWSAGYLLCVALLGCCYQATPTVPAYAATLMRRLLRVLMLLWASLFAPLVLVLATMLATGFTLPPVVSEAQLEQELQSLLTHLLLLAVLPFLLHGYLRRFRVFCTAYLHLLESKPRVLALTMPMSSHFGGADAGSVKTFQALRAAGY